jgi:transcription elongation factor GreA
MDQDKVYVSKERLASLKKELENLKTVKRIEVAENLKRAKELGDLSENAEYSEARDEQSRVEDKIGELEDMIRSAVLIKKSGDIENISLGSSSTIKRGEKKITITIVGKAEASPEDGRISNESPMGKALIGKKVGEKVVITTPAGAITYEVCEIE